MRVAIIGSGIAGLGAAWALRHQPGTVLFEAADRLGGHACTIDVETGAEGSETSIGVDIGFIVFNRATYPNFCRLIADLGIGTVETNMSFSFAGPEIEWSTSNLFFDPQNRFSPGYWQMLGEFLRFSREAKRDLAQTSRETLTGLTLGDYLRRGRFSPGFRDRFLLPMATAIWSSSETRIVDYPARAFLQFFANHGLLSVRPPFWRTIAGGSRRYVAAVESLLGPMVRKNSPVRQVRRIGDRLLVTPAGQTPEAFDHVIFACRPDEAHAMAPDLDPDRAAALAAIRYAPNTVVLHRDPGTMPQRRANWAAWNVARQEDGLEITYWMNRLQAIDRAFPLFVTLNPRRTIAPEKVIGQFDFAHPQFNAVTEAACRQIERHQGQDGMSFAGAWLGYGFHEDGLRSGLLAAQRVGGRIPWDIGKKENARKDAMWSETATRRLPHRKADNG